MEHDPLATVDLTMPFWVLEVNDIIALVAVKRVLRIDGSSYIRVGWRNPVLNGERFCHFSRFVRKRRR